MIRIISKMRPGTDTARRPGRANSHAKKTSDTQQTLLYQVDPGRSLPLVAGKRDQGRGYDPGQPRPDSPPDPRALSARLSGRSGRFRQDGRAGQLVIPLCERHQTNQP